MPKATILIVEDEAIIAKDLSQQLTRLGYGVLGITATGEEAVVLARERRPDVILMDIRLKGPMDGIQAAEQIGRDGKAPVIYLTAHSDSVTLQRAKLTEPFGYILKPFEERDLETHIEMALYKHQTERKLRQSEALYRAVGESINYGVWVCAPDGRNIYASPSFLQLVGLTQQQCSDFGWGNALHPDDAQRTIAAWKECVRTGGTWDIEHRFRGLDGQWHPILARGVPVRDEQGHITSWAGINLDIARLKQAEDRLRDDLAALTRMHALSGGLLQPGGLTPLLQEIMDAAVAIMEAERGTLQVVEEALLRIVAHHGHQPPFLDFFASAETRASVCGEAMMRRERVVVPDVEKSPLFAGTPSLAVLREAGVRAVQSTPIVSRKGPLLGILTTQWGVPHSPDEHDLWRIDLVARQAADLIEYAQAEKELRRRAEELSASNKQLQAWHTATVGRELRMVELKKEIDGLCAQFGEPPRYGYGPGGKER